MVGKGLQVVQILFSDSKVTAYSFARVTKQRYQTNNTTNKLLSGLQCIRIIWFNDFLFHPMSVNKISQVSVLSFSVSPIQLQLEKITSVQPHGAKCSTQVTSMIRKKKKTVIPCHNNYAVGKSFFIFKHSPAIFFFNQVYKCVIFGSYHKLLKAF